MKPVTLVYPFYDNRFMLLRHLQEWLEYSPALKVAVKINIVDDASPNCRASEIVNEFGYTGLDIRVWRVQEDIPWNQDGARNLAMLHAATEWTYMTDMDHLLPKKQAEFMMLFIEELARPGEYYMPTQALTNGVKLLPHPNSYLMRRDDFWAMGGYDEDFAGWYGSDGNFRKCCRGAGMLEFPVTHWHTVVHRSTDIADANTKLSRKDGPMYAPLNAALNAKRKGPAYKASRPIRFQWVREL